MFVKKFLLFFSCFCVFALVSTVASAQNLLEYRKMLNSGFGSIRGIHNHHPSDVLRKTGMDMHDVASIPRVKDSLLKIEYLEVSFKT